ncbi:MAG: hypothetical protein Q7R90_00225 [bacterium]|nr:hypothetical protein [bacterium]
MYRSRTAALFLFTCVLIFTPAFSVQAAGNAADLLCTAGDYTCDCGWNGKECTKKNTKGVTCMQGKPCEDSFVRGQCTIPNFCSGKTCFSDGAWKDCTLTKLKVEDVKKALEGSPTPPPPLTNPNAPAPGNSVLQSAFQYMSGATDLKPPPEGTNPFDQAQSSKGIQEFIEQQSQINPQGDYVEQRGFVQQFSNDVGSTLERWGVLKPNAAGSSDTSSELPAGQ